MSALPRKIGSYQVSERLEGHDREVYLAVRPAEKANRRYVLAFFDLADDAVDDFEAEVMRTMELDHPQLTRAVELLVHEGRQVIAYEGVPGASLLELQGHLRQQGQRLGDGAALYIVHEVCVALTAAHMATDVEGKPVPLVHAQLGPHQVFLSWEGEVKLLGIGLSTIFRLAAGVSAVPDDVASYTAPEVRKGGALTVRANLYTVAGLAWSLLTNEPLPDVPQPLGDKRPDLDDRIVRLLDKALNRNLMKRTVTCAQIARVIFDAGLADAAELQGHMEELRAIESFEMSTIGSESFPPARLSAVPRESIPPLLSVPPESDGFPKSESELLTLRPAPPSSKPVSAEPSTIPRRKLPARKLPAADDEKKPVARRTIVGPPPPATTEASKARDEPAIGSTAKKTPPKAPPRAGSGAKSGSGKSALGPVKAESAVPTKRPTKKAPPPRPASEDEHAEDEAPEAGNDKPAGASTEKSPAKEPVAEGAPKKTLLMGAQIPAPPPEIAEPAGESPTATEKSDAETEREEPAPSTKDSASLRVPEAAPDESSATVTEATAASPASVSGPHPADAPRRGVLPLLATAVVTLGIGFGLGRFTAPTVAPQTTPPPTATTPTTSTTTEPTATEPTAADPTAADPTATESAAPEPISAPTASATATASSDTIAPGRARLVITTVYPEAHVYVGGEYLGPIGEALEVECGVVNIRLGTKPLKRWYDEGRAVNVKCGEVNEITIAPDPDPYPYE